jgi:hypothetical protein
LKLAAAILGLAEYLGGIRGIPEPSLHNLTRSLAHDGFSKHFEQFGCGWTSWQGLSMVKDFFKSFFDLSCGNASNASNFRRGMFTKKKSSLTSVIDVPDYRRDFVKRMCLSWRRFLSGILTSKERAEMLVPHGSSYT